MSKEKEIGNGLSVVSSRNSCATGKPITDYQVSGTNRFIKALAVLFLAFFSINTSAQTTTKSDGTTTTTSVVQKTKILVIPWDPKMFNCSSDITRAISSETGQKYNQVQEAMRKGMVEQLKKAFGNSYTVTSLIDDTAKMKADLHYVYTCTSMSYTPVNFPLNPTKADSAKLKKAPGIQKGQVQTTEDETDKFMNTVVLSPNMMGYLKKKYGADYVVFFNEIDIDNDLGADPYNLQGKEDFTRSAIAHWTIFSTADGKRIAMGKTKSNFSSNTNTPKKIIDGTFSTISKAIYTKFAAAIKPKQ